MPSSIILASGSQIRARLLEAACVPFTVERPRVDEDALRAALQSDGASPRDIADALAEMKSRKVSDRNPEALVIGCDQVLDLEGQVLSKPETIEQARQQLVSLRNTRHMLLSAAVIYEGGKPVWRHVGVARMMMRAFSDAYLDAYLDRNWGSIRRSVGGYKLEEEGVRLFSRVDGDYFCVLGLPLVEILSYLTLRGELQS